MADTTVQNLVREKLPFLTDNSNESIEVFKLETFVFLQPYLKKSDAEVEEEANYALWERSLVSYIVAADILTQIANKNTFGENGNQSETNQFVKKAQADVVLAEFELNKSATTNYTELLTQYSKKACSIAQSRGFMLPGCGDAQLEIEIAKGYVNPFIFKKEKTKKK